MIPASTYRLQVTPDQDFDAIRKLVPYFHRLGIEALYLSPVFHARSGSTHGYDAVDPTRISDEIGGENALRRLVEVLQEHEMGLLLDIVPNHLAATPENPWWRDVLEHGRASPFASWFDIEWERAEPPAEGKVVLPILGERYGKCLAEGQFTVEFSRQGFGVRYFETVLPLDPRTYPRLVEGRGEDAHDFSAQRLGTSGRGRGAQGPGEDAGAPGPSRGAAAGPAERGLAATPGAATGTAEAGALSRLMEAFAALPDRDDPDAEARVERVRRSGALRVELWETYARDTHTRDAVDDALAALNSGSPEAVRRLDALLADQPWWLAFWRTEADATNYRRFFNISDLVGVRVELPEVFRGTHDAIEGLVRDGSVTGLRVDHIDGLLDPAGYLDRLRALGAGAEARAGGPLHLVVEKILAEGETLPTDWPVSGSTGYDFLATLNGLFVDPAGLASIERHYREVTGFQDSFAELLYRKKRAVARVLFAGDFAVLARRASRLVRSLPGGRDFTAGEVNDALVEITASLPVYRTYLREEQPRAEDQGWLETAVDGARRRAPGVPGLLLDLLRDILTMEGEAAAHPDARALVRRWQQFTGAVMAKGMEDTTFYIYNALVSLNEVGGEPGSGATPISHFHGFNERRLERWPGGLNTTSTHDTKRSEDVRTRISVLSEMPAAWEGKVRRWRELNRDHRVRVAGGELVPSPNEEIMLYQILLGAWPLHACESDDFRERLREYLTKALREAKVHSSWRRPDADYEEALASFAERILDSGRKNPFLDDFQPFQGEIAFYGALNSLSQLVLKVVSPGVPDFYQGTELWTLSLVDPDNRRPVDFAARSRLMDEMEAAEPVFPHRLLDAWQDGRIKLLLTRRALNFRRRHRSLFLEGAYLPLRSSGIHGDRVVAAARHERGWVIGVAPRWYTRLAPPGSLPLGPEVWKGTELELPENAPTLWKDALTGQEVAASEGAGGSRLPLGEVFTSLPVALLEGITRE